MKIRTKESIKISYTINKYCCGEMTRQNEQRYIDFNENEGYLYITCNDGDSQRQLRINHCPFCGEKIEVVKK